MADRLRIVEFRDRRSRPVTIIDVNDLVNTFTTREGGFNFTPPAKAPVMAGDERRFGGDTQRGEAHGNGQAAWTMGTKGASGNDCLTRLDNALAELNKAAVVGRYLEWRAEGASYSSYFPIRGTAAWNPLYRIRQFVGSAMVDTTVALPVAPLVEWDAMDILDDFSADSIGGGDYTVDAGAGTIAVVNGQAVPSSVADKNLRHTVRGYRYIDAQQTIEYTTGTVIAGGVVHARLRGRWVDANNELFATLEDATGAGVYRLRVWKRVAGANAILLSAALTTAFAANTRYWLRFRYEGNVVSAEHWLTDPALGGTPDTIGTPYTLTAGEAAVLGSTIQGGYGWGATPGDVNYRYDSYRVEPLIRTARNLPEQIDWADLIPGTAPALVDLHLGTTAGQQPVFAALGWARRPTVHSYVWNGDFEDPAMGVAGWSTGAVASIVNAPTSVTRVTTTAKYGLASCQIVTPGAGAAEGTAFALYRRFRKGVSYTAGYWARVSAGAPTVFIRFGTVADFGTLTTVVLTGAYQLVQTTWTPTADADVAWLALSTNAAVAATMQMDGVLCYETALGVPTGKQGEGRGAVPPLGVLAGASADPSTIVNWVGGPNGTARNGYALNPTAGIASHAEWLVDPSLIASDDFRGEVDVEVWMRHFISPSSISPRAVLSLLPEEGTAYGPARYTNEWGAVGKALVVPSAGGAWRVTRLGTITMPVDPANPRRYRLALDATLGSGSTAVLYVDQLVLVPAKARMASPSGKANDATYPKLAPSSGETRRVIRSDGRGLIGKPGGALGPYGGVDGARCWPEPGALSMVALLSDRVPDDPTSDATADATTLTAALIHAGVVPRSYNARGA